MFSQLKNKRGQGVAVQYALTFTLVMATVTAMTFFVRRTLQGRIYDARNYMVDSVRRDVRADPSYQENAYVGNLLREYEPYYLQTRTDRDVGTRHVQQSIPVMGETEVYRVDVDDRTLMRSQSNQLSPREAN